jgi:hypothetical protein
LREASNTIGKAGKLGEERRRVVSVSMLTVGWDASTVSYMLRVRPLGTDHRGSTAPYHLNADSRDGGPNIPACVIDGSGPDGPRKPNIEVSGQRDAERGAKAAAGRNPCLPPLNKARTRRRWALIETGKPWDAQNVRLAHLTSRETMD